MGYFVSTIMNRRSLLKKSALFGAPFVLPSNVWGAEANGKVNVGFIGTVSYTHLTLPTNREV